MDGCIYCGGDHAPISLRTLGERIVNPNSLLRGMGVPWTAIAPASAPKRKAGRVYFAEALGAERIKIGWTQGDPRDRIKALGEGAPFPVKLLVSLPGTIRTEQWFHRACREAHAHLEWFHAEPLRPLVEILRLVPGLCYWGRQPWLRTA